MLSIETIQKSYEVIPSYKGYEMDFYKRVQRIIELFTNDGDFFDLSHEDQSFWDKVLAWNE
jgi:hypothetical protein